MDLVVAGPEGAVCARGGFVIDPLVPVPVAVITHAHGDHLRPGSALYVCANASVGLIRKRIGDVAIQAVPYGERVRIGDTTVSFHPAGHVLGSSQVRIEADSVWVVTGDCKLAADPTCAGFEVVPCDTMVIEATFALPIFRWDPTERVVEQVFTWWQRCADAGKPAVLLGYALGKSQRILAELRERAPRPIRTHGAVESLCAVYREAGVALPPTVPLGDKKTRGETYAGELIVAPPGSEATPWMRRFPTAEVGFLSGWMAIRGHRRRRNVDRGFVLSDHADWADLHRIVDQSDARRVLVTHGFVDPLVRSLRERGVDAQPLRVGWQVEEQGSE